MLQLKASPCLDIKAVYLHFRLAYNMIDCFFTIPQRRSTFYINRAHFEDNIYVGTAKVSISFR